MPKRSSRHGDRCVAFHFSPEVLESVVAAIPGARGLALAAPRLPPVPSVLALLAAAQALRDERGKVDDLAAEAAVSPFHFLRMFERVVGVTPGQYMMRTRLHRAAVRLRRSNDTIAAVALDCGFDDLSTFNRQFRHATGLTPGAYRARRESLR